MGTAPAQCAVCSVRRAACDVQRATRLEHPERGDPIGRDAVIRVALSRRIRSRSPLPRRQPAVDGDPQVARRALSPRRRLEAQVGSQVVLLRGDAAQMLQCTCAGDIPAARSEGPPGHPVGRRDPLAFQSPRGSPPPNILWHTNNESHWVLLNSLHRNLPQPLKKLLRFQNIVHLLEKVHCLLRQGLYQPLPLPDN